MNIRVIPTVQGERATPLDIDGLEPIRAADVYRRLTGVEPQAARLEADGDFDRHVFACIMSVAASETGALTERIGVTSEALAALCARHFSCRLLAFPDDTTSGADAAANSSDLEEAELVRDILLQHLVAPQDEEGQLLAAMIARRALEPNHLWEDLGLRSRSELTRLMERRFASLAARNDKNMRWKRFIYRLMCENDGFVMCATPICTNCADYNSCFGEETGVSRLNAERPNGGLPSV